MVFEPLSDGVRKLVFREPREQLELCIVEELQQDFDARAASSPEGIRSLNTESLAQLVPFLSCLHFPFMQIEADVAWLNLIRLV